MVSGVPYLPSNCNPCKTTASTTKTATSTTREAITATCNSNKYWQPQPTPTTTDSNSQLGLNSQLRCTTFERGAAKLSSPCPCNKIAGRLAGQGTCPSLMTLRATTHCEYNNNTNNKNSNKTKVTTIQQQLTMPNR